MTLPLEPGDLFADRFRIVSELGSGGIGTVYLARHQVLQRSVAIKVLHPDQLADPGVLLRFEREARAASLIRHPNVTEVHDFGHTDDGVPYLVMEYVDGPTLHEVLRQGPLEVRRALALLSQMAQGLQAAHDAGVLHRDLKPANVLLARQTDREQVKLCDFGLAKIVATDPSRSMLSVEGLPFGTPEYMAPEHCLGETLDRRADVYSFGAIAYALITGAPPFRGSVPRVLAAQVGKIPPPLSSVCKRADLPSWYEAMVSRCLQKRPEHRFQNAADLIKALAVSAG